MRLGIEIQTTMFEDEFQEFMDFNRNRSYISYSETSNWSFEYVCSNNSFYPKNHLRDIDQDGMPDYKEIHYREYYPFLVKWANNKHIQNPNDFNATEYLKNQFNPFVKENIPPMLLTVSVNHWNEWGWEKCEIRARVYDAGGIGNLWIYHDNFGDFHSFKASNNGWYNITLDIGWGAGLGEYTIHMEAWDIAENHLMYNYTVKGLFSGVLDFLKDIWNAVTGALSAAWNAIKSALNFIVEWIKGIIDAAISAVLEPLMEAISKWYNGFIEILKEIVNQITSSNKDNVISILQTTSSNKDFPQNTEDLAVKFAQAFFSPQMWSLAMSFSIAIVSLVTTINVLLKALSGGALAGADNLIVVPIVQAFGASMVKFTIIQGISEVALGSMVPLLHLFIPASNPIWESSVFMNLISIIQVPISYSINYGMWESSLGSLFGTGAPKITKMDAIGLTIAIIMLLLDIGISSHPLDKWSKLALSVISTVFSGIAFAFTLSNTDFIDRYIGGGLAYIEEIISGISTVCSSMILGKTIAEIAIGT